MLDAWRDGREAADHELDLLLLRLPVPSRQEWAATASDASTGAGIDAPHSREAGEVAGRPGAGRQRVIAGLFSVLMWGVIVLLIVGLL